MKLSKLFKGLKNIDHIVDGIKNNMFRKPWIEEIANHRWIECKKCDKLDTIGGKCAVSGTQPCCADCGCALPFKIRSLSAACPKGKWEAHVTAAQEAEIIRKINNKNNIADNDSNIKVQK
tara:strand:+ start:3449 stop:3808 length:360 start_codon:yes stop_codon:yes gene_type:complete